MALTYCCVGGFGCYMRATVDLVVTQPCQALKVAGWLMKIVRGMGPIRFQILNLGVLKTDIRRRPSCPSRALLLGQKTAAQQISFRD